MFWTRFKINIQFGSPSEVCSGAANTNLTGLKASLYVDYVYLDTDERRRFAQVSHEMLIEQLQFTGDESVKQVTILKQNVFERRVEP